MTTILCFSSLEDKSAQAAVSEHVRKLGARFQIERMDDVQNRYTLSIGQCSSDNYVFGEFNACQIDGPLAIWHRRCNAISTNNFRRNIRSVLSDPQSQEFFLSEYSSLVANLYTLLSSHYWVNSPVSTNLAASKLKNLQLARSLGLQTPPTLVSNDPSNVLQFAETCAPELVLKPFSSFEIRHGNTLSHCVARKLSLDDVKRNIDAVSTAPVFMQKYIQKQFELRVVVIGSEVFPVAIYSQEHARAIQDWRCAPLNELRYAPFSLPRDTEAALLKFNKSLDLQFSAFDLIVGTNGEIYFLECNSDGEWYWLELATSLPMARSLAELLVQGCHHVR